MRDGERMRLYCFPHAGAGVSAFQQWTYTGDTGPVPVSVLLPGRAARRHEPRVTSREKLLADLLPLFDPPPVAPYVLYGHSLGGLIAHTLARALHEAGLTGPALVAVGACPPPDVPTPLVSGSELPEDELLGLLDEFGAVPPGVRPGGIWHRATLPVLRDDLRLAGALRDAADGPLTTPLLVLSGRDDPLAGPEVMKGWRRWSTGRVVERTVAGDHFFVRGRELPRLLGRACRVVRHLAGPGGTRPSITGGPVVKDSR